MLKKINFSWKHSSLNIDKRNSKETILIRENKIKQLIPIICIENNIIIYIDESGYDETLIPLYGYSKKGQKFVVVAPPKT